MLQCIRIHAARYSTWRDARRGDRVSLCTLKTSQSESLMGRLDTTLGLHCWPVLVYTEVWGTIKHIVFILQVNLSYTLW